MGLGMNDQNCEFYPALFSQDKIKSYGNTKITVRLLVSETTSYRYITKTYAYQM